MSKMSNQSKFMIAQAIAGVLALSVSTYSSAATNEPAVKGMEKCYGIAKAHQNDCHADAHQCAGEAKKDGDPKEYLLVPTGLCKRIVGGKTKT